MGSRCRLLWNSCYEVSVTEPLERCTFNPKTSSSSPVLTASRGEQDLLPTLVNSHPGWVVQSWVKITQD